MNILLFRPKPHKRTINLQSFMICEPLELEYCAAYLEKFGHKVTVVDFILDKKSLKRHLENGKYDMVGMTGYICHIGILKNSACEIKKFNKNIITIVGGVHAEVMPEDFKDENIDYILSCNGLNGIVDIANGKNFLPAEQKIEKSFKYPFPDRNKTAKYRDCYNYIFHEKCATIKTSFGCPYDCEFCFCTRVSPYFTRELSDVIEELKTVQEENIFIVDDNFLFDKNRAEEFCRLLTEHNIRKNFIAFARADFIIKNKETLLLLKSCGFEAFFVGLESFKNSELDDFNKRTTVDENIKAVKILEECGLRCYAGIIVGYDWQKEDFDNMIRYINSFNNIFVNIQPLTPMPGTPLYQKLKDKIIVPREKFEFWDMAHLLIKPTKIGKRQFYYHIIRAYLKTTTNKKTRKYVKREFGNKVYKRVKRGTVKIFWQYVRLMIFGR